MIKVLFTLLFFMNLLNAKEISGYFHQLENNTEIANPFCYIDYIYLINLDCRPEKLETCMEQLLPYGVIPSRFSAVNGWLLSSIELEELGTKVHSRKLKKHSCRIVSHEGVEKLKKIAFERVYHDKTCFSNVMTQGAIGCTLSHLSVLQDAYDSGYEIIWVLEDDIKVIKNPLLLDNYIYLLNSLVGKDNWDILYTDLRPNSKAFLNKDYMKQCLWRPDMKYTLGNSYSSASVIDKDFMRIKSRLKTHSMIISRSGIKKILDFVKKHHIFRPYDLELAIIPDIKLYNLCFDLVSATSDISDNCTPPSKG